MNNCRTNCGFSRRLLNDEICPECATSLAENLHKYSGYTKVLFQQPDVAFDASRADAGAATLTSVYQVELHLRHLFSGGIDGFKRGCRSVLYWGHNGGRHDARFVRGLNSSNDAWEAIRSGVTSDDAVLAVESACELPQFGFAYGTKLLSFVQPARFAVLDRLLAEHLEKDAGWAPFDWSGDYLSRPPANAAQYGAWLGFVRGYATRLNEDGAQPPRYCDELGPDCWRPVDIERALFAVLSARANPTR